MVFSRSVTFDEEDLTGVTGTTRPAAASSPVEVEFIERLRAGESEAFDLLVTRYSSDVYAVLYRITENAEEAGDLTQDTFLSALRAIKNFRGDSELKTWLFRIALNESRNRFRWWKRRRRELTLSLDAPIHGSDQTIQDTIAGNGYSPEETVLRRERERALAFALGELPEIFREALVLCDISGHSYDEIASILGVNIGTVKSRIARGREELRRRLKDF